MISVIFPEREVLVESNRVDDENKELSRKLKLATRMWDMWKQEAFRLSERLNKYEHGSPMILNNEIPDTRFGDAKIKIEGESY